MTGLVLALLLAGGAPVSAAEPLGGYRAEEAPQTTTEDAIQRAMGALQDVQGSPLVPPETRAQVESILRQNQALREEAGVEYSRPAGMTKFGPNPRGERAGPRAAPALDMRGVETRVPVDISASAGQEEPRAGAAASGAPLAPPSRSDPFASLRDPRPRGFGVPLAQRAKWAGRAAAAEQTLERRPGDTVALGNLARGQLGQGRWNEAAATADRVIAVKAEDADAFMLRAMALERMGDRPAALKDAERAAQLDRRFQARYEAALAGGTLFDPASEEAWGLLEQMTPPPAAPRKGGWLILLGLLCAAGGGAAGFAARTLWKDLAPEERRRIFAWRPGAARKGPNLGAATPMPRKREESLKSGAKVGGKYELLRLAGRDGTLEVWKGHDAMLGRDVLLKRLYAGRDSGELDLRRADARAAAGLHHPNIAELYEILELPEGLFAVFEYASGKTLRQVLAEKKTLSLRQARDVLVPVCRALEHAHHRGVSHGGLSPERVVLTRQGYVKVTDFILARTMGAGTEAYAAPEAKRGMPTPVSDVYALGMLLHELLSGERPGEGEAEPPAAVQSLLERALDLDATTRLGTARGFLEGLRKTDVTTLPSRPIEPPLTSEPDDAATETARSMARSHTEDEPLVDPGPPTSPGVSS